MTAWAAKRPQLWLLAAAALVVTIAVVRPWRWLGGVPAGYCPVCLRHEHKESMVRFQAEGERVTQACCLSCALTYGRQARKPVTIVSVTDHASGASLVPAKATFVVGSDVSPCTHTMMHMGAEKEAYPVHWDRCLPSILAFATPEAAQAFRAVHGGRVRSLDDLLHQAAATDAPIE